MDTRLTHIFQWMRRHASDPEARLRPQLTRRYSDDPVAPCKTDEAGHIVEATLPALYGRMGVLPDYFTDELLLLREKRTAMQGFLDIFNHRMFGALFQTWQQHQLFTEHALQSDTEQGNDEAHILARLAGQMGQRPLSLHIQGMRWHRMNLYRSKVRSADGLRSLVSAFFPNLSIQLETFVSVDRKIPEHQQVKLGQSQIRLGMEGNFLTGKIFKDPRGGMRLKIKTLDYNAFMKFLPGGEWRKLLAELVKDYTQGNPQCLIHLELQREEVPTWQLGQRQIGRDMWLKTGPMPQHEQIDAGVL